MSGRPENIPPKMDEEQALALVLEKLIDSVEPDVAEAMRLGAIPHWFNEEILVRLLDEKGTPSERTREILSELARFVFVRPYHDQGYTYHKSVRNLLLGRWRQKNAGHFRELSGKTASYYADKLELKNLPTEQRAEWECEEMYHLMAADEERGIDQFISLCNRVSDAARLSTFHLLLGLADEQAAGLSAGSRLWIQFFKGKQALLSGNWEEALKIWETLVRERERISVDLEKTLAVHLSLLYKDKGEWDKAIERFQHSLEILEELGDERGVAVTFNNLGFLYKDRDQSEEAIECFSRSLEIFKKLGDERGISSSLNNLGLLYKDKGDWDKATECFQLSLEILERTGDKRGVAATCNDLGFLYKDKGEWEEADKYFQRSLEILNTLGDEHGKALTFNSLGFLYTDRKEWAKAGTYFRRALKNLMKIGDERRVADTFSYLGFLYRDKKEWVKADEYFRRGLLILEKMGDERGTASMLNNLGWMYKRKGDLGSPSKRNEEWEKAADYFRRSLKIVEQVGDELNAATTMYNIALLCEDMQQHDAAVELLEKVVAISEKVGHPDLRIRRSRELLERVKKRRDNG